MAGEPLLAVAEAVSNRTPVDWESAAQSLDDRDRAVLEELRSFAALAALHADQDPHDDPRPDSIGDAVTWNGLKLVESVGEGSFGRVFRAWDPQLDREVALKLLHPGALPSPGGAISEGRLLARVKHPNVVTVHAAAEVDGQVGLTMEFVHGRTLESVLETLGPFGARETVGIGVDLCRALAAVHSAGLLHRDIKAQNVIRENGGRIVLMDFGAGTRATGSAELVGTPLYLAPEVLAGGPATAASDLYSLGVLLFHLLTGTYPVVTSTIDALLAAHNGGSSQRLRDLRPDLPDSLIAVVERSLAPAEASRFHTAAAFESALSASLGEASGARPGPAATRFAGTTAMAALAMTFLAAAAGDASLPHRAPVAQGVAPAAARYKSLAVLPFKYTGDSNEADAYLADGFTEELISGLSHIPNLRVTSRTSVMTFRESANSPAEIAKALGVDVLVEGSVSRREGWLRARVTLVEPREGRTIQSWTHDQKDSQALILQRRALEHLTYAIQRRPANAVPDWATRGPQVDGTAYLDYLRGRYQLNKRTEEGCLAARGLFGRAIERQPDFAPAHAGLADAYLIAGAFGWLPLTDVFPKAEAAARLAISLDPTLAEPHATLGYLATNEDWTTAEREYLKAIELNPNYVTARQWYALSLKAYDPPAAVAQLELASQIDPLSPIIGSDVALVYHTAGRIDDAIAQLRRVVTVDPSFAEAHRQLAELLEREELFPEALVAFEQGAAVSPEEPLILAGLAATYRHQRRFEEAKATFARMRHVASRRYVASIWMMTAAAAAGDVDAALRYGREGVAKNEAQTLEVLSDPAGYRTRRLSSLQSLAAYHELLKAAAAAHAARTIK